MADVWEKDLAQKSSLTTSDFIRVVGSDNVSYKQLVSDVAMALSNALPLTGEVVTSLQAWAETVNGKGITSTNTTTTDTPSSAPRKYGVAWTNNYNHGSTKWLNLFWTPTQSDEIYYCHKTNTTAWTAWQKLPTRAEMDGVSVTITGNTDYLTNTNFYAYAVGNALIISGWFQFKSATAIPAQTTLITLGNSKQFKARYYLPLYTNSSSQPFLFQLECRENTAIARTRETFTPSTPTYYYLSATVAIK